MNTNYIIDFAQTSLETVNANSILMIDTKSQKLILNPRFGTHRFKFLVCKS